MSAKSGRAFTLKKGSSSGVGGTLIAGCRTKNFSVNNTSIDTSTDDSAGVKALLEIPGEKSVAISVSGIADDEVLLTEAMSATDIQDEYLFEWATSKKLYGLFNITSFTMTGEYQGAVTFEASFESAGTVTAS